MTLLDNEQSPEAAPLALTFPERLRGRRLLLVTESLGPTNGVTRATLSLIDYLQRHEVDLTVIAPYYEKAPDLSERVTKLHWFNGFPLPYNPELRVVYPFRLKKFYQKKALQPELMYLASPASLGGLVWLQSRGLNSPPMIANFQTDLAAYARTILPRGLNRAGGWLMDYLHRSCLGHSIVKKVLYPSEASRQYLESIRIDPGKLVKVGRGVDTILFNPARRSQELRQTLAPNGELLLLCVSRLSLEKGYDFLAQVAHRLFAENVPCRMVITGGNNNPAIEKSIRHLFGRLDGQEVIFSGARHGEPLAEMFASADVFVYPSVTETFGQVIQEAMASGLPVIARRQGGPADLVEVGATGFLPAPQSVDEFVAAIKQLVSDPEMRQRYGQEARRRAEQATWEAVNNQIAHLLADNCLPPAQGK